MIGRSRRNVDLFATCLFCSSNVTEKTSAVVTSYRLFFSHLTGDKVCWHDGVWAFGALLVFQFLFVERKRNHARDKNLTMSSFAYTASIWTYFISIYIYIHILKKEHAQHLHNPWAFSCRLLCGCVWLSGVLHTRLRRVTRKHPNPRMRLMRTRATE